MTDDTNNSGGSTLISIRIGWGDVRSIAEEADPPVSRATAMCRAVNWSKAIEEAASTLVNEQLYGAIVHDQP